MDVFEQTLEFIMRSRIDCVELRILTPYPGTRLNERSRETIALFLQDSLTGLLKKGKVVYLWNWYYE